MDRRIRAPEGAHRKALAGGIPRFDHSTLNVAATTAFRRELSIIMAAADRMANGYKLAWDDYTRLHQAWQHCLSVLEVIHGHH